MNKFWLWCLWFPLVSWLQAGMSLEEEYEQLYRPTFLAIHPNGDLYVVDNGNHRIVTFDSSGKYKASFGRKGMGPGEFQWPSSVGFLNEKELFVSDSQKKAIYIFNQNGDFLRELFKVDHGLGLVYFQAPDRLIVTESDGHLWSFNMDPDQKSAPIRIYDTQGKLLQQHGKMLSHKIPFIAAQRNHGSVTWFGDRLVMARMVENQLEIFHGSDAQTLSYAPAFPPREPDGKMTQSKQPDGTISYQMEAETDAHCFGLIALDQERLLMLRAKGPESDGITYTQLVILGWDGRLKKILPGQFQAQTMTFDPKSKLIYLLDENDDGWFVKRVSLKD